MEFQMFLSCVTFLVMAGSLCMPVEKRFLVDCNEQLNCSDTEDTEPTICGTDGNTYLGKCFLDMKNQERFCKVGDFNEIGISHKGNCTQDD